MGTYLCLRLRENYKVFATYSSHPVAMRGVTFIPLSVENRNWAKRIIYTTQPDVIVYLAGNNSIEWTEAKSRLAELLHSSGLATIANAADILQPKVIYHSSSYVFDGVRGNYHENDTVLPGNVLGKSKLGGENVVKNKCLNYVILRSSPMFGRGNGTTLSFLDQLRMKLDRKERIEVATDEFHSFLHVDSFCELMSRLIDSGIRNRVLHFGGLTKVTYLDFAKFFAKRFRYDPNLVVAKKRMILSSTGDESALDFSLNSSQVNETLKIKPLLLEESFDLIEQKLVP